MIAPTMNGNTLTFNVVAIHNVLAMVDDLELKQFSVIQANDGTFLVSTPVTKELEDYAPGMIHGARGRAAPEKPKPDGGPDGDGTPPGGGTPGTPVLERYTKLEARAA